MDRTRTRLRIKTEMLENTVWYSLAQRYYMSDEETREQKAKILLESSENQAEIDKWEVRAREIAASLRALADRLENSPEQVVFSGEETPLEFQSSQPLVAQDVALSEIQRVRDNLRQLKFRRRDLQRSKDAFRI